MRGEGLSDVRRIEVARRLQWRCMYPFLTLKDGLGECRVRSKKESGIECLLFAMTIPMARFPQKKMDDIS